MTQFKIHRYPKVKALVDEIKAIAVKLEKPLQTHTVASVQQLIVLRHSNDNLLRTKPYDFFQ